MDDLLIDYDFNQELQLDPPIKPLEPWNGLIQGRHIFLTGATGFLGSYLFIELLQTTKAHIYCLCRKESYEKFSNWILKASLPASERQRIHIIIGDLCLAHMGIEDELYTTLTHTLDLIYHAAACVGVASYHQMRQTTLNGTKELLKLACCGPLKPFCFISSLGVFMSVKNMNKNPFDEGSLFTEGTGLLGGYTQTKWVSEHLIQLAAKQGLPTCIIRPTRISFPLKGYETLKRQDNLSCLLNTLINSKSAPNLSLSMGFMPVDRLSQALVTLALEPSSYGHSFNFVNEHLMSMDTIISFLKKHRHTVHLKPYDEWIADPRVASSSFFSKPVYNNLSYFECMQFFKDHQFSHTDLTRQLKKIKPINFPTTHQILNTYLPCIT